MQVAGNLSETLKAALATVSAAAVCAFGGSDLVAAAVVLSAFIASLGLTLGVYMPYVRCAREQKRLESVTKSPLLSFFAECCGSAALVRAFGAERRYTLTAAAKCDDANRSVFYLWTTNQWLRLQVAPWGSTLSGAPVVTGIAAVAAAPGCATSDGSPKTALSS